MRAARLFVATMLVILAAGAAYAQPDLAPMSALQTAVACAPPTSVAGPPTYALRIVGAQDTVPRALFGPRDLLVIDGGTASGVQLGQQFFVRRENRFGKAYGQRASGVRTLGWISVVALNESTAIARIDHVCGGIIEGDYLDPFVAPAVPPDVEGDDSRGEPDFSTLAQVVAGNEDRRTAGAGDFVLIDRGADRGVTPGVRIAFYRDLRIPGMPLAAIGDAVVVSVGPTLALTRITRTRDAVQSGDYAAMRK